MQLGFLYAALAFVSWGLFPLYLRTLAGVPALEIALQRSAWALLFVLCLLAWLGRWQWLRDTLRQPRRLAPFMLSAVLLTANWLVYVYAVQAGRVLDTSLGYFINPLVNVLLGVLVLGERLRRVQWLAVAVAAAGVLWLTLLAGHLPWVALVLACSFGLYGLVRKTATLGALEGLALENLLLAPVVLPLLAWMTWHQGSAFTQGQLPQLGWIVLGGPLTALPLLWFAAAARRLPLAVVGMVQYVSPSIQFLLAVWVFHEPFDQLRLVGFCCIWASLALLSADALHHQRRPVPAPLPQRAPGPPTTPAP